VAKGQNLIFSKPPSTICGPCNDIVRPKGCQLLDYEIELALILKPDLPAHRSCSGSRARASALSALRGLSSCFQKVRILMGELGIDYTSHPINLMRNEQRTMVGSKKRRESHWINNCEGQLFLRCYSSDSFSIDKSMAQADNNSSSVG
jgi:hypothetical protein